MTAALLVLAVCWMTAFSAHRDLLFPPVILSTVWAVIILLAKLNSDYFLPLSGDTLLLVVGGVCSFTASSIVACAASPAHGFARSFWERSTLVSLALQVRMHISPRVLLAISLVALPLAVLKVHSFASAGPTANWFINARYGLNEEGESIGWLGYAGYSTALASSVVLWAEWANKVRESRVLPCAATALAIAHALLTTGRTTLVTVFVSTAGVLLILRRSSWRAVAVFLVSIGATLFIGATMLLGKAGDTTGGPSSVVASIWSAFSAYLLTPLWALDIARISDPAGNGGVNAFRFFQALGAGLKLAEPAPSLVEPWVFTPEATNVYTVHLVYLRSGGVLFSLVSQAIFGAVHSLAYVGAMRKSTLAAVAYGFLLYPLMMQFFSDQYLSLTSLWLQITALVILMTLNRQGLRRRHTAAF